MGGCDTSIFKRLLIRCKTSPTGWSCCSKLGHSTFKVNVFKNKKIKNKITCSASSHDGLAFGEDNPVQHAEVS